MYNNIVLNLFNNPKNAGRISKPDGIADYPNFEGTAHVEFSLRIESGVITEAKFRAQANPYIVAVCSTITQMLKGKMISMLFLDATTIKNELGEENDIDINFCIECVKLAVLDYKEKLEKSHKTIKEDVFEEEVETKTEVKTSNTTIDDDDDFADFFDDMFDE